MKAILVDAGRNLVWSDVDEPVMQEDEVLVEIAAAALNRADILQRQGKYPSPAGCPEWMGLEISGVVARIGREAMRQSNWKVGDKVCALLGGGGYAQRIAVRYDMLMPVPQGLTMEEAAALPEAFATSYLNLFIEGKLQPGQNVFIPAGTSGLASASIPLARAFGARVITTTTSDDSIETLRQLGAHLVINSKRQSVPEALNNEAEQGYPIHVAMDCLGGDDLGPSLPYMARGGYWIVISTLAGSETVVPLRHLLTKGLHIVGSTLRNRAPEMKAYIVQELIEKVWPKLENGDIRPQIYKVFPIEEAEEAHRYMDHSGKTGKIVLKVM